MSNSFSTFSKVISFFLEVVFDYWYTFSFFDHLHKLLVLHTYFDPTVIIESAKSRGWRGFVGGVGTGGAWVAWVKFWRG